MVKAPKQRKRWRVWLGRIVLLLFAGLAATWFVLDESPPEGASGPEADRRASEVYEAVGMKGWQKLNFIAWTHRGRHHYQWNKRDGLVKVSWAGYIVLLDLNDHTAEAYQGTIAVADPGLYNTLCELAWEKWYTDVFWLNPFTHLKDEDTKLSTVMIDDERTLLAQYYDREVAPGTHFLWYLDDDYKPYKCQMWADNMPIGGITFTWEDWVELPGGARVATKHTQALMEVNISNVRGGFTEADVTQPAIINSFPADSLNPSVRSSLEAL